MADDLLASGILSAIKQIQFAIAAIYANDRASAERYADNISDELLQAAMGPSIYQWFREELEQ